MLRSVGGMLLSEIALQLSGRLIGLLEDYLINMLADKHVAHLGQHNHQSDPCYYYYSYTNTQNLDLFSIFTNTIPTTLRVGVTI